MVLYPMIHFQSSLRYPRSLIWIICFSRHRASCYRGPLLIHLKPMVIGRTDPGPFLSANIDSADSSPSFFSVLSSEGLHWLHEKSRHGSVDLEDFDSPLHPQNKFIDDDPLADGGLNQPFIPLPPKYLALQLLHTYFREINPFCPLFDEEEFVSRVEREYPIYPQSSPSWWACINATIALSCAFEPEFNSKAWLYWKNATLSLNNFFIGRPQLPSAQALIAMVKLHTDSICPVKCSLQH